MNYNTCPEACKVSSTCDKPSKPAKKNQIYKAVKRGNHALLEMLLSTAEFCEINDKRLTEKSALDVAAGRGDFHSIRLLLKHGAIPNYNRPISTWSQSTLGRSIRSGNQEVTKLLIDAGCNPDDMLEKTDFTLIKKLGSYNCWYKVVENNDIFTFRHLLVCTGRKICNDEWSQKLLLTACSTGSIRIIDYLINQGVPVDSVGQRNMTGAFYALFYRHISTFKFLITRGSNIRHTSTLNENILHVAVAIAEEHELTEQLLNLGLDVNQSDINKRTPLHYAMIKTNLSVIEFLLERGAKINAIDIYNRTPINALFAKRSFFWSSCAMTINYKAVKLLLQQKDIDLCKPDVEGITVLHRMAFENECPVLQEVLIRPEININVRDDKNETPLEYLIKNNCFFHFGLLLDFGADTKVLHNHKEILIQNENAMIILVCLKIKRSIAGFDKDPNIDAILKEHKNLLNIDTELYTKAFLNEIEIMKDTILINDLTYFDFLHAKKRRCIMVASRPEMRSIFLEETHKFHHYSNMLSYNYIRGLKPLTNVEIKALEKAENNLDFILDYRLPSLLIYKIKKYLDIEDMVTLQSMKLLKFDDKDLVELKNTS